MTQAEAVAYVTGYDMGYGRIPVRQMNFSSDEEKCRFEQGWAAGANEEVCMVLSSCLDRHAE